MTDDEFITEAQQVLGRFLADPRYRTTPRILLHKFSEAELSRLMDGCEELVRMAYSAQEFLHHHARDQAVQAGRAA